MKPETNEYNQFYSGYVEKVKEDNCVDALKSGYRATKALLGSIPDDKWEYRYSEGKWTPKEMLLHILDAERVFAYRALRFSRGDETELSGYDHNIYIATSEANSRSVKSLLKEYRRVRKSTITMFSNFPAEAESRVGMANADSVSVRALGFIIAGHEKHHLGVLQSKYLQAV